MMWFKCKYDHYSYCDIDEDDTLCEGCETGIKCLEKLDEPYEPDPDEAYERARDEGKL